MKVIGISNVRVNHDRDFKSVTLYLEDDMTSVKEGVACCHLIVYSNESNMQPYDVAMSLHVGDNIIPYRNANGYLESIYKLEGRS